MSRIAQRFAELKALRRAAFIPFITAGDPDYRTSLEVLKRLPSAGADLIELGVPFSDPMADGPSIQAASLRALRAGMSVSRVFDLVREFRKDDHRTPVVLMGYFNPIHAYGPDRFVNDASQAGADGLITVDLPPEEDAVLRAAASANELDVIRLATPTSDPARLPRIVEAASGFLYYVSVAGVTGTKTYAESELREEFARLKQLSHIPCAVGFGIKTAEQARRVAEFADAVVVGSAIVDRIAAEASDNVLCKASINGVITFCSDLAQAVHTANHAAVAGQNS